MKELDQYNEARAAVFTYFGFVEQWRVLPLDDAREYYWCVKGGEVYYAATEQELASESGEFYSNEIYTQRHYEKWEYRGAEYTMIMVDTHCDGNQFLQVFSNDKERRA